MLAAVRAPFRDGETWAAYAAGDAFEGDPNRVAALVARGLVSVADDDDRDLSGLAVAQLRSMCDERGIAAPRRATKAQLVALLGA